MHGHQRRQVKPPHICIRSLLTLALLAALAAPAMAASESASSLPCAEVTWDAATGWPSTLRHCQLESTGELHGPEGLARAFLDAHHAVLGLAPGLANLRVASVRHGLGSSHVVFQQTLAGYPIDGALISVHFDGTRQIQAVHHRGLPELRLESTAASIAAVEAVRLARAGIQFGAPRASSPAPELLVLPETGDLGRLAWRVMVSAAQPQGDWEVWVDAATGAVIKRYNRLAQARGQVLDATPSEDSPAPGGSFAPSLRTVALQGLDGSGWLRGQYVDVTWPVGYRPAAAFSPDGNFHYDLADPRFQEVMVYTYVDSTQRYIQSLGYSDRNDPPNGIRERVTFASPHWFDKDQSFYSVSDDALHFGDGGWADALDPDIIVHEYGHALLYDLAPHWGGGEMEAIGEGFGDYLAASRFAETSADTACIGELDSRAYVAEPPYCLRRVDRDRQYPHQLSGDPHRDGEIWSRVLWDVRTASGATVGDSLALESSYFLPAAASLVEAGQALLDADSALYQGRHRAVIVRALQARGLAPLPAPILIVPRTAEVLAPASLYPIRWQPQADLPVSYEVQWSPNAGARGDRQYDFAGSSLPEAFGAYGNAPWVVGDGTARSGGVDHGQSSSLALSILSAADGQVSFRYRVDGEPGYDAFEFLIDGQVVLRASGQAGWSDWSTALSLGQHELVWRYSKDGTSSRGEDAAWIDDLVVTQASLAEWWPVELASSRSADGEALWRVPASDSASVGVRVRARVGAVSSPWSATPSLLAIDGPTAVSLGSFDADTGPWLIDRLPWVLWGLGGLLAGLALGVALGGLTTRRRC